MLSEQALQLVDTVAQVGSFTAAAAKLNKVPSAISYAIKQIEDELGTSLFNRHHRSVSLTPAGEHFVAEARAILKQLDAIKRSTQQVANGWQPRLGIAVDTLVRADRVSLLIADFYRHFDDVELVVSTQVFNGVWESLTLGHSQLAIGATTAIPVGGIYQYRDMGHIDWQFLVSRSHPLAQLDRPLTDEDMRGFAAITVEDTAREIPKRQSPLLDNQRRILVPDWIRAINCFREGLGVGYMPAHLAAPFVRAGALIEKQLERPQLPTPCCLAWNCAETSPALTWLLDYLGQGDKLQTDWLS
ncbi:DNA-binding transcriptional activator PunR [Shewanella cyperi]|uniref:DNA-binding transcriptional activator PunR n=1 Tax=Shewanella cyperi TaxID=2814292 RepID=UPI001A940525|nr:DNA-binding transcriptional activator PunR [Shewanella cyperi]QSX42455.1 LysR family transcriptional regulator [Shewanella cyperi]